MAKVKQSSPFYVDSDTAPDVQLANAGRLVVLAGSVLGASTALGNLIMHYDITFQMPQYSAVATSVPTRLQVPASCWFGYDIKSGDSGFQNGWSENYITENHWFHGVPSVTATAANSIDVKIPISVADRKERFGEDWEWTSVMMGMDFDCANAAIATITVTSMIGDITQESSIAQTYPSANAGFFTIIYPSTAEAMLVESYTIHVTINQILAQNDTFHLMLAASQCAGLPPPKKRSRIPSRESKETKPDSKESKIVQSDVNESDVKKDKTRIVEDYHFVSTTCPSVSSSTTSTSSSQARSLDPAPLKRDVRQGWFSSS
jgi:hypothetical protein